MRNMDELIRRSQSTRLRGEAGVFYGSNVGGMLLQFSREAVNLPLYLLKDLKKHKKGLGILAYLIAYFAGTYLWNKGTRKTTGIDPFGAYEKTMANREEDDSFGETAWNFALELAETGWPYSFDASKGLSGIPVFSAINSAVVDPITGIVNMTKGDFGIANFEKLTSPLTSFKSGGLQAEKVYRGIKALVLGYSQSANGKVRFAIDRSLDDWLIPIFGDLFSGEGQEYLKSQEQPMSTEQDEQFYAQTRAGMSSTEAIYNVKNTGDVKDATTDVMQTFESGDRTNAYKEAATTAEQRSKITWPAYTPEWSAKLHVQKDRSVELALRTWRKYGDTGVLPKQTPKAVEKGGAYVPIIIEGDKAKTEANTKEFETYYREAYQNYVGNLDTTASLTDIRSASSRAFEFAKDMYLKTHPIIVR
jgi:hypothetical protein